MPDATTSGKNHFAELVEQAVKAEQFGFDSVSLPEHHLINILLMPSPLQMAVKIAAHTQHINIITAVAVLPLRDMRIFAGELVQADCLCDDRLILGVGRGAFAYEMARLGTPIETSREKMQESLDVLQALLCETEVSWNGKYYQFDSLTIMPRPERDIPMMLAVMDPEGIYQAALRGFHIQTTVLHANADVLQQRTAAFHRAKSELGERGRHLSLSLQRVLYCARDEKDAAEKRAMAYEYYQRFDNVFTGPGAVHNGCIEALPRGQSLDELSENLLIYPPEEMIDRLALYQESAIDELILSSGMGQCHQETLEAMQRFSEQVMPHFQDHSKDRVAL